MSRAVFCRILLETRSRFLYLILEHCGTRFVVMVTITPRNCLHVNYIFTSGSFSSFRHYKLLNLLFNLILPTMIPWCIWNESLRNAFFISFALRYAFTLNAAWCVNSFAHMWGTKPYDESIAPAESLAAIISSGGEGFHNFHHTFPQDYNTSESFSLLNMTSMFINAWAWCGLAYDLKTVSKESVLKRRMRSGDLQHLKHQNQKENLKGQLY